MIRTPALNLIVGVSAFSLAGVILYIWYRKKDDEDEIDALDGLNSDKKLINSKSNFDGKIVSQIVVPQDKVPIIIGRSGANVKGIEDKCGVKISFRVKDDDSQYCEIYGKKEAIESAKQLVLNDVNRLVNIKEEIFVPKSVCGAIMGRCGESIQEICRKSLARVAVQSGDNNKDSLRKVVISGTREQVDAAKILIEAKVQEDEEHRKNLEETELKREPRRSPTQSVSSLHSSMTSLTSNSHLPFREKLTLSETDTLCEVFVSAIASPAKFWLQLIGPQTKKLDQLVDDMTNYYNDKENQKYHRIADPYLGQIVAALFKYDNKWYRAEIVGILPNDYNPRDVILDLYFVDYGDSEYIAPSEVFQLRTDFLQLRFQAIECFLANVKPTGSLDSDMWDPMAITKFEQLTHVATWKLIKSRVITYKERPRYTNHIRREGSPVPGVELFDNEEGEEINIAVKLINEGFALPDNIEKYQLNNYTTSTEDENTLQNNDSQNIKSTNEPIPPPPPPRSNSHHIGNASNKSPYFNGNLNNNGDLIKSNGKLETENFLEKEKSPLNNFKDDKYANVNISLS